MKRTALPANLQRILSKIHYATIATVCEDGQPWNSPVLAHFDGDLTLYWVSWKENQHSQNIRRDPRIFVVVYDSTVPPGTGLGIYLKMRARAITDEPTVLKVKRTIFQKEQDDVHGFVGRGPRRVFTAKPLEVWHNTDRRLCGYFIDTREKIM
jgi:Pyridoxamine 5'-phosphate oxidase